VAGVRFLSESNSMFRNLKIAFIIFVIYSDFSFADYGSGVVDIRCNLNKDLLVISTYIKWNEEYDSFMASYPKGAFVSKEEALFTLRAIDGKNDFQQNYNCQLKNNFFTITIGHTGLLLVLNQNKKPIYKFTDSYPSNNDIYGLSYSIKSYYLKISSNEIVTECITRKGEAQVCEENVVNKVKSKPNKSKQQD
jgi:hypothetical protein